MSDASHPASPSASTPPPVTPRPSWLQTLRVYLEPASLRMLALGFSAGLPLLLVLFIGGWIWVWSPRRKAEFDDAAALPLNEEDEEHKA